jgi:hypothetical protein
MGLKVRRGLASQSLLLLDLTVHEVVLNLLGETLAEDYSRVRE